MIKTGIVSATFRPFSAEKILALARDAKLDGVEWSGDVHVLPGDLSQAKKLKALCQENQISVCGYASYYRLGANEDAFSAFAPILDTARELGAPIIRIWAGTKGSSEVSDAEFRKLTAEASLLVSEAQKINAVISFEYHQNTLTDNAKTALRLLNAVPGSRTHWQTSSQCGPDENLAAIMAVKPYITTIHVQQCKNRVYSPLAAGKEEWIRYFSELSTLPGEHYACLEFVKDGTVQQFLEDARTLKNLILHTKKEAFIQ